jgi:hypothetical protein
VSFSSYLYFFFVSYLRASYYQGYSAYLFVRCVRTPSECGGEVLPFNLMLGVDLIIYIYIYVEYATRDQYLTNIYVTTYLHDINIRILSL